KSAGHAARTTTRFASLAMTKAGRLVCRSTFYSDKSVRFV
ncbi:MAG: hypothetical protein ACI9BW_002226, partial [Gammaproteobacteria bacterium]